jgi:hypothetical protein
LTAIPVADLSSRIFFWLYWSAFRCGYSRDVYTGNVRPAAEIAEPDDVVYDAVDVVFMSMTFPSGLALYWVVSNIISIVMQYFRHRWVGKVDPGR